MTTKHLPLSAGTTTMESSLASSRRAFFSAFDRLLVSFVFSSHRILRASPLRAAFSPLLGIHLQASSIPTTKSSYGIFVGDIAYPAPLERTFTSVAVRVRLERFLTHLLTVFSSVSVAFSVWAGASWLFGLFGSSTNMFGSLVRSSTILSIITLGESICPLLISSFS